MRKTGPFILPLIVALAVLPACDDQKQNQTEALVIRPVKALKVSDASAFQKRTLSGRAKATREVELSFRVPGNLLELPVNVGDKVDEGGLIARLDPATYQAEVDRVSADLQRAQASFKNAKLQFERQTTLFEKGHVAKAAVDSYEARQSQAKADVASRQAALNKAQLDHRYTSLRAPFNGVIVAKYVENFEDVRAKQRVARLLDPSQVEMVVNIPENLISLASTVLEAEVVFDAFPETKITATIKEIGTEASQSTRTYPVTLIMDQPEGVEIMAGMAGKASAKKVVRDDREQAVIVPPAALFSPGEGKSAVWLIDESSMTVAQRDVQPGELTSTGIRVKSGLKAGEWVVTAGVNSLKEGQKVRILEQ
ncbi:MAG: efflux RND transporter periplasmic adaptor subunit [Hyphomicrobiales bacterium]|nr:efflux RND transporter periplasmic adaptor subunit [Hyphomicrobiales bacterium]